MSDTGRAKVEYDGGIPPGTRVQWVAECTSGPNQCTTYGSLVMTFDTQAERVDWARGHRQLGHTVLEYMRPHPSQSQVD